VGLFAGLLTLPLAPVRGVVSLAQMLEAEAYRQWTDPARIRSQLAEVDEAFQAGRLTEDERTEQQNELIARLMAGRRRGPL
jgi:hypothetical protein